jgi:hypothetical protein
MSLFRNLPVVVHWAIFTLCAESPVFLNKTTKSRRLFLWAGERRRWTLERQFAAPPVATRNGLAQPTRIGAPTAYERSSINSDCPSLASGNAYLPNKESPEIPGRTNFIQDFGICQTKSR